MYKCEVCNKQSNPKQAERRFVLYKDVGVKRWVENQLQTEVAQQIKREVKVCGECLVALQNGTTLNDLIKRCTPTRTRPLTRMEQEKQMLEVFNTGEDAT
jgi:hypothetical protein